MYVILYNSWSSDIDLMLLQSTNTDSLREHTKLSKGMENVNSCPTLHYPAGFTASVFR